MLVPLCNHFVAVGMLDNFMESAGIPSKAFSRGSRFPPFNKRDEYSWKFLSNRSCPREINFLQGDVALISRFLLRISRKTAKKEKPWREKKKENRSVSPWILSRQISNQISFFFHERDLLSWIWKINFSRGYTFRNSTRSIVNFPSISGTA